MAEAGHLAFGRPCQGEAGEAGVEAHRSLASEAEAAVEEDRRREVGPA